MREQPFNGEEQDRADMLDLAGGRDTALNDLMDRHGRALYHYLIRQLGDEAEAADLAQETFVRVYEHRRKFNPKHKFTTWLYTIATNLVRDRFRWRKRHPQVSLDAPLEGETSKFGEFIKDPAPKPADALQASERIAWVRRALAALPLDLRTPLVLSEYEEKSHQEIGAILGCSPKAVEMRLYRARQQLKKMMEKEKQLHV